MVVSLVLVTGRCFLWLLLLAVLSRVRWLVVVVIVVLVAGGTIGGGGGVLGGVVGGGQGGGVVGVRGGCE